MQVGTGASGVEINPGEDTARHNYVTFELKRDNAEQPSEGSVSIYGLNTQTESLIREEGERVRILAGYAGNVQLVFDGDIRRIDKIKPSGQDRRTDIIIGGNVVKQTAGIFNKSYSGPVAVSQIVADAVPTMNLFYRDLLQIPVSFIEDFTYSGKTTDLLTRILQPLGVIWREQDGFIEFSAAGKYSDLTTVYLGPDSGMLGSPTISEGGRIKVLSLFNPLIVPGHPIVLKSETRSRERYPAGVVVGGDNTRTEQASGRFKILSAYHTCDNRVGPFQTEVLCMRTTE